MYVVTNVSDGHGSYCVAGIWCDRNETDGEILTRIDWFLELLGIILYTLLLQNQN